MRKMSTTINHLATLSQTLKSSAPGAGSGRLQRLDAFGPNPGALNGWFHYPAGLAPGAPLVVVLHGCTQTAAGYDHGSGWSELADRHGFAVLFPEQTRANNPNLCFNWFTPEDNRRGAGEPASIHQMIETMIQRHRCDPARVHITGLSAGGAMTSIMLATYPDVFAAGAIIAGLAYGNAHGVPQALERMRGQGGAKGGELARLIPAPPPAHDGWPAVSIWHGTADSTVALSNAADILDQWRGIHRLSERPDVIDRIDGHPHRAWLDRDGRPVIEEFIIDGMGHGTPLDAAAGVGGGKPGPHMLDVGISSTNRLAEMWGLATPAAPAATTESAAREITANVPALRPALQPVHATRQPAAPDAPASPGSPGYVGEVIEKALRAAGLMR